MSTIFNSKRLHVRFLSTTDKDLFYEMMSDPEVMNPIPQKVFSRNQSDAKLHELIGLAPHRKKMLWAITEKDSEALIGICGFLINSDNNYEIAYRFRKKFWGKGYGSEVAESILEYGFRTLNYSIIDADVNSENIRSIKILDKYMTLLTESWNHSDHCFDIRYRVTKADFLSKN